MRREVVVAAVIVTILVGIGIGLGPTGPARTPASRRASSRCRPRRRPARRCRSCTSSATGRAGSPRLLPVPAVPDRRVLPDRGDRAGRAPGTRALGAGPGPWNDEAGALLLG